jgi:hypothetical protein
MDLFNEAYYQLEKFGYSDDVIHQWLTDEYNAAHGAQPGFNYTVSDTTRLLKDYATWNAMYPVDVYDIHVYDDVPWDNPGLYAAGKALQKPWFAGEAGCAPGNVSCTYDGTTNCTQPSTCALSVNSWFLNNLKADGAQAVLVEMRNTAWAYPDGPTSGAATLVGQAIQSTSSSNTAAPPPPVIPAATATLAPAASPSGATFSNGFDDQSTGGLVTGTGANQFSGTSGFTSLRAQNTVVSSPPNALAVALNGGGSAYVYKQYGSAHTQFDLTFNLQLGADFTLDDSSDYVNVAQTVPSTSSNAGKVTVVLPADHHIRLDYFDSAGQQHYLWGSYAVPTDGWHKVELRETMGAGSGSLALLVDGNTVASGSNLDLGPQGLTWFAVGERYAPPNSETAGHLYIDDVAAADPAVPTTIPGASAAHTLPHVRHLSPRAPAQRSRLLQRRQRQHRLLHSAQEELLGPGWRPILGLGYRGALRRHHPQPLGRIVLSPAAKGHGSHKAIPSTHSSTLRSLAQIYKVRPLLGHAQNATALGDLVPTFP